MTVVLVEMDVARVSPYRFGQGQPPVLWAWLQPRRPTAGTQFRGGGGHPIPKVCLLPGGRRPPGPEDRGRLGMRDDFERTKRGQLRGGGAEVSPCQVLGDH